MGAKLIIIFEICKIIIDFYSNFIRKMGGVMGTGTLVHSLGSMNLSPMIPYLIFNKDSIFKSNSSVRLKKGKTSSSDHSKQSS